MIPAPQLPDADPLDILSATEHRRTPFGEFIGSAVSEAFWGLVPGQAIADYRTGNTLGAGEQAAAARMGLTVEQSGVADAMEGPPPADALTPETYRTSPHFREGLPFVPGMTPPRAAARADVFDENQYRRWVIERRQATGPETAAAFVASMAAGLTDPVTFIPFAGPAFRTAAIGRVGSVLGRAATEAVNVGIARAVEAPFADISRIQYGDDVTFAGVLTEIAMGAALGSVIGGGTGVVARLRGERIPTLAEATAARSAISEAASQIARGEAIDIGPQALRVAARESLERPEPVRAAEARPVDEAAPARPGEPVRPVEVRPAEAVARAADEQPQPPAVRPMDTTVAREVQPAEAMTAIRAAETRVGRPVEPTPEARAADVGVGSEAVATDTARFREIEAAGRVSAEDTALMKAADEHAARADAAAKGFEAAAVCHARTP